jgi:hypothetical protein
VNYLPVLASICAPPVISLPAPLALAQNCILFFPFVLAVLVIEPMALCMLIKWLPLSYTLTHKNSIEFFFSSIISILKQLCG